MLTYCGIDTDCPQSHAKFCGESLGIPFRSSGGAKTWHGDGNNIITRPVEPVKGLDRHQQGQRGIQSTGDAQNHFLAAGMLQTFHQTSRLDGKDFFATLLAFSNANRDKGCPGNRAKQVVGLAFGHFDRYQQKILIRLTGSIAVVAQSFMH